MNSRDPAQDSGAIPAPKGSPGESETSGAAPSLLGLLYVGEDGEKPINMSRRESDPIAVYVANAITLARSAFAAGMNFTLVTNAVERVAAILTQLKAPGFLSLREHQFVWSVPIGIPFRSTHFKLELMQAMARDDFGSCPVLLDLDVVVLRAFRLPELDGITSYEMSPFLVPAYGAEPICQDLSALLGKKVDRPAWYGGGFLGGGRAALRRLACEIDRIWPRYLQRISACHHVGDDMVVSAALLKLRNEGIAVADAAAAGLMGIFWSSRTLQPLDPLSAVQGRATLHLPADKSFLAAQAGTSFRADDFLGLYRAHARRQRWMAAAKNAVDAMRGGTIQALPRL